MISPDKIEAEMEKRNVALCGATLEQIGLSGRNLGIAIRSNHEKSDKAKSRSKSNLPGLSQSRLHNVCA